MSENFRFVKKKKKKGYYHSLRAGFEPTHGDRIGFQVQRLNHSAIAARPFGEGLKNLPITSKANGRHLFIREHL